MSSLNSFVLSLFLKDVRFNADIKSALKRNKILSVIYSNILFTLLCVIYDLTMYVLYALPTAGLYTVLATPFSIMSFLALRYGKYDLAASLMIPFFHTLNFSASTLANASFEALIALIAFPHLVYFLGCSVKGRILNVFLCGLQFFHHATKVMELYNVTLIPEQSVRVSTSIACTGLILLTLCASCLLQKSIETNLWEVAISDYENVQSLTKEVLQAVESKDAFVSMLSHEIRNPLNSLNGSIDYLLGIIQGSNQLKILNHAKLSGEILLNLVNNVLDAAKLKSDKMELSNSETNFSKVIKKALIINSEALKKKGISVKTLIDRDLPDSLWMDPSRLLQIVMNLISNAIKFTPESGKINVYVEWCCQNSCKENLLIPIKRDVFGDSGEDQLRFPTNSLTLNSRPLDLLNAEADFDEFSFIEKESRKKNFRLMKNNLARRGVSLKESLALDSKPWIIRRVSMANRRSNLNSFSADSAMGMSHHTGRSGYLKVQISDTGCGIAEKNIPKLFEIFTQANKDIQHTYGGTGLGLWISKQLCHRMGGDITLYSKVDVGTSFLFYIPIFNSQIPSSLESEAQLAPENVRALVVDDYPFNRDLHRLLLERQGVQVVTAINGQEALDKFIAVGPNPFSFIMMDIQMPVMDGFTAAQRMRNWETETNRKKVDIIFVSGEYFSEGEMIEKFRSKEGTSDLSGIRCIRKPIDVETISKLSERYTGQKNREVISS